MLKFSVFHYFTLSSCINIHQTRLLGTCIFGYIGTKINCFKGQCHEIVDPFLIKNFTRAPYICRLKLFREEKWHCRLRFRNPAFQVPVPGIVATECHQVFIFKKKELKIGSIEEVKYDFPKVKGRIPLST